MNKNKISNGKKLTSDQKNIQKDMSVTTLVRDTSITMCKIFSFGVALWFGVIALVFIAFTTLILLVAH